MVKVVSDFFGTIKSQTGFNHVERFIPVVLMNRRKSPDLKYRSGEKMEGLFVFDKAGVVKVVRLSCERFGFLQQMIDVGGGCVECFAVLRRKRGIEQESLGQGAA